MSKVEAQREGWLSAGPRQTTISLESIRVDGEALSRALGYGLASARAMPGHLADIATAATVRARSLLAPIACWSVGAARFDPARDVLRFGDPPRGELAVGNIVGAQLRSATAVAVFVVTIGARLEQLAREIMRRGAPLEGYVLDTIGSVAVESCGDWLEQRLTAEVAPWGWRITNRFSPGYCTWATADQHALFRLLPAQPAGVELGDSALMTPIKSISGIIGLGANVQHQPYACEFCRMESCHQRLEDARF